MIKTNESEQSSEEKRKRERTQSERKSIRMNKTGTMKQIHLCAVHCALCFITACSCTAIRVMTVFVPFFSYLKRCISFIARLWLWLHFEWDNRAQATDTKVHVRVLRMCH